MIIDTLLEELRTYLAQARVFAIKTQNIDSIHQNIEINPSKQDESVLKLNTTAPQPLLSKVRLITLL